MTLNSAVVLVGMGYSPNALANSFAISSLVISGIVPAFPDGLSDLCEANHASQNVNSVAGMLSITSANGLCHTLAAIHPINWQVRRETFFSTRQTPALSIVH